MDWKTFFDRLGMNGTRWQWRMMKWERNLREMRYGNVAGGNWSATKVLIATNLLLYAVMVAQGLGGGLGFSVLLNPGGYLLIHSGAQYWPLVFAEGEWWRCITYAFAHGGLIHLAFNMVVLHQIGPMVENEIGTLRFLILYVLTALTATFAGFLWQWLILKQWVTVVGASGSLFGLIGFAIAYLQLFLHEAAHWNLHPSRKVNDLLTDLFVSGPVAMDVARYRPIHFDHHRFLGSPDDTEISYFDPLNIRFLVESLLGIKALRVLRHRAEVQAVNNEPTTGRTRIVFAYGGALNAILIVLLVRAGWWPVALAWGLGIVVYVHALYNVAIVAGRHV